VRQLARPERDSGRAADGRGAVVALVESALVDEVLLDQGEIVQRLHVQVLVVRQDKHNVGLLSLWPRTPRLAHAQRLLLTADGQSSR
jgi:hypothetical protein